MNKIWLDQRVQKSWLVSTKNRANLAHFESIAALCCIGIGERVINMLERRSPVILIAPILVLSVPMINIAGWLLGRLSPRSDFMPLGFRVLAKNTE